MIDGPYSAAKMITHGHREGVEAARRRGRARSACAPNDASLHRVRLLAKRARFAAEAAMPVVGPEARRFARAMSSVQDVLGIQHDAVVAHQWVRTHAVAEASPVSFAGGMVAGLLAQQRSERGPRVPGGVATSVERKTARVAVSDLLVRAAGGVLVAQRRRMPNRWC